MKRDQDLSEVLGREIIEASVTKDFPAGAVLISEGQFISSVPVVIKGLIKVFTKFEDKELLLYYIRPNESCIMSFSGAMSGEPSRVSAVTEEPTSVILLPMEKLPLWVREHAGINTLFFRQYNQRYSELLDTINQLLFARMDKRLYDHLRERSRVTGSRQLFMTHRQIAAELGTAREVVSRVLKKLEREGKISQNQSSIEILDDVT